MKIHKNFIKVFIFSTDILNAMDKKGQIILVTEDVELIDLCRRLAFDQFCELKVRSPKDFSETHTFPLPNHQKGKKQVKDNIVSFPKNNKIVPLKNLEKLHLKRYIELYNDDITSLSKKLGISRSTFYRKFGNRKKLKKVA